MKKKKIESISVSVDIWKLLQMEKVNKKSDTGQ